MHVEPAILDFLSEIFRSAPNARLGQRLNQSCLIQILRNPFGKLLEN
jgi:hypothetical protein